MFRLKFFLVFILMFFSLGEMFAQTNPEYNRVDNIMSRIPDSLTHSTKGIAKYINANCKSEASKSRAVFSWITANIRYDVDRMNEKNWYQSTGEILNEVLKKRKGVCTHYAELFKDISVKVGLKMYVMSGFTKQYGRIGYRSHAWCGGFVESNWVFFDPTWGAGVVQNRKFVKQLNNTYFMVKPGLMIQSHIPFDPLWQFLNYPLRYEEFTTGKVSAGKNKNSFIFPDSLKRYDRETEIERLISSNSRIERNGVKNGLVYDYLSQSKMGVESRKNGLVLDNYNAAVECFNDGIRQLNAFIDFRNAKFMPKKEAVEMKQMLDSTENSFNLSKQKLNEIVNPNASTALTIGSIRKSMDSAVENLKSQQKFLDKYLNSSPLIRKTLFYKYTWMGVPLNQ